MKKYTIITSHHFPDLVRRIEWLMNNEGWQLQGGVATTKDGGFLQFSQALTKEIRNK